MRASFLSDFYLLRSSMKSILSVFIFIMVFGMVQHSTYLLFFYPAFYSVFLPFSLFSMSEQTGWEWTLIAAPISRRGIVAGRYLFCQIFTLLMLLIGLICSLVIQAGSQIFFSALLSLSITLLIHAIILPLIYRLGPTRSRFYLMAIFLVPSICIPIFAEHFSVKMNSGSLEDVFSRLLPLLLLLGICLLIFALSYLLSCRIYSKREF